MAKETICQTEGAVYNTQILPTEVSVNIKLPFKLDISADEALLLEANLHNVIELVLSRYFNKSVIIDADIQKFGDFSI